MLQKEESVLLVQTVRCDEIMSFWQNSYFSNKIMKKCSNDHEFLTLKIIFQKNYLFSILQNKLF